MRIIMTSKTDQTSQAPDLERRNSETHKIHSAAAEGLPVANNNEFLLPTLPALDYP